MGGVSKANGNFPERIRQTFRGGSWTQPKLSAIINGRRNVTETIALDFADALGATPQLWLNLQATYNLWNAMKEHKKVRWNQLKE